MDSDLVFTYHTHCY